MQNFIQNLNTVSNKACILSQNLKTLTGSNYPALQYFLLKLRTHLQKVYKTSPTYQCFAKECAGLFYYYYYYFFQLGFTPCKAEQPLQGMELQEKEAQKD